MFCQVRLPLMMMILFFSIYKISHQDVSSERMNGGMVEWWMMDDEVFSFLDVKVVLQYYIYYKILHSSFCPTTQPPSFHHHHTYIHKYINTWEVFLSGSLLFFNGAREIHTNKKKFANAHTQTKEKRPTHARTKYLLLIDKTKTKRLRLTLFAPSFCGGLLLFFFFSLNCCVSSTAKTSTPQDGNENHVGKSSSSSSSLSWFPR